MLALLSLAVVVMGYGCAVKGCKPTGPGGRVGSKIYDFNDVHRAILGLDIKTQRGRLCPTHVALQTCSVPGCTRGNLCDLSPTEADARQGFHFHPTFRALTPENGGTYIDAPFGYVKPPPRYYYDLLIETL